MKISDAVKQLSSVLPYLSDRFSNTVSATATSTGGIVTVNTVTPHGLVNTSVIEIIEQPTRTPLSAIVKSNVSFTITAAENHDLTLGFQSSVTLGGFTAPVWNDAFDLTGVPNRLNFIVRSGNSLPTLNGGEYLEEVKVGGLNGRFSVTVIDNNNFTYSSPDLADGVYSFSFRSGVRVAGVANFETAQAVYTQSALVNKEHCWCFCYMNDATASKDRSIDSDATALRTAADDQRTRIVESLTVAVFIPTTFEIVGVEAVDIARNELLKAILGSINGVKFDNEVSDDKAFQLNFNSHGQVDYNRAYYAHQYTFENVFDITACDNVSIGNTAAFRDISETLQYNQPVSIDFSLDDKQL